MTDVTVVVGGQFGSEGKGAIAAHISRTLTKNDVAVRVAGPNAGHTAYDEHGNEWKLRALPVAAVTNRVCKLHIAAGSEVDLDVLVDEINRAEAAGFSVENRLTVHPSATLLTSRHKAVEAEAGIVGRIGSTGKGIGAARADRVMRTADTYDELGLGNTDMYGPLDLDGVGQVLIEGTQGYGLGLHTSYYPQVTSSDCRAIDFLAMAGISPWDKRVDDLRVVVVARVYPIRVAGNSGPLHDETTWEALGLPEERTTVTNKVRRVGQWDQRLVKAAIDNNGGGDWNPKVVLALTMLDQLYPHMRDQRDQLDLDVVVERHLLKIENALKTDIVYVGTGPSSVVEVML
jgi:adenylosuccinate synthase